VSDALISSRCSVTAFEALVRISIDALLQTSTVYTTSALVDSVSGARAETRGEITVVLSVSVRT
jgi:hypothetical protein